MKLNRPVVKIKICSVSFDANNNCLKFLHRVRQHPIYNHFENIDPPGNLS